MSNWSSLDPNLDKDSMVLEHLQYFQGFHRIFFGGPQETFLYLEKQEKLCIPSSFWYLGNSFVHTFNLETATEMALPGA